MIKEEYSSESCLVSSVAQSVKANMCCPVQTAQELQVFTDFVWWTFTHTSWGTSLCVGPWGRV